MQQLKELALNASQMITRAEEASSVIGRCLSSVRYGKPPIEVLRRSNYLHLVCIAFCFSFASIAHAQTTPQWTWMNGSKTIDQFTDPQNQSWWGVAGTCATPVPGPENAPPATIGALSWTDEDHNLWVFGGITVVVTGPSSVDSSALWEFKPSTDEWACISSASTGVYGELGVPAGGNGPPARTGSATWTDLTGHLWLFGGGAWNDLWEYFPLTNEWAWMGGSSQGIAHPGIYGSLGTAASANIPGSRSGAATWIDSKGDMWLFGGTGIDVNGNSGNLNDLWMFNPSTIEWTWMGGPNTINQSGVYGSLGVSAPTNIPGARTGAYSWTDSSGNFWLFGGNASSAVSPLWLGDMWEFNPSANEWTWTGGSDTPDLAPSYGTLGVPAPGNTPGARNASTVFTDQAGNFWLFGGLGYNDMWEFSPTTNEWAWMAGPNSSQTGVPGVYGTLGTPSTENTPGNRDGALGWTDANGNFWIFGGQGEDGSGNSGLLNDVWRYQIAVPAAIAPTFSLATGTYDGPQTVSFSDVTPGVAIYYTTDGTTPTTSSSEYTGPITISSTETLQAFATASGYTPSTVTAAMYTLISTPVPSVQLSPASLSFPLQTVGISSGPQTVALTASGNASTPNFSITVSGDFTETNTCPVTLNAPSTCLVSVMFTPKAAGIRTGTLSVSYSGNGFSGSPQTMSLTGTGLAPGPAASVTPTSLTFASQNTGTTSAAQTVILTNPGNAALSITSIAASGDFTQTNTCGNSVLAFQSCLISVKFTPTASGSRTGTLTITDNAVGAPQTVALSGTGTAASAGGPAVTLSPTSLTFASQPTGSTSTSQTVTLTNSGNAALSITSIAASGDFADTHSCGMSLAAGVSCTISVTFTPTTVGSRTGTLTITDNASSSPQTVALSGTGASIAVSGPSTGMTVGSAGGSATATIQISSADGFSGMVNLTCAVAYQGQGTPADAPTCSLNPSQTQISSSTPATATLTINTTAGTAARLGDKWLRGGEGTLACLLLFGVVRRRTRHGLLCLIVLGIIAASVASGCGSGGMSSAGRGGGGGNTPTNPGTTTGSYNVAVTATSGSNSASVTIPLSVQ